MSNRFWFTGLLFLFLTGCTAPTPTVPTPTVQNNFKVADNNTPQTQDRLQFNFKYFDAVPAERCVGPLQVERQAADGSAKTIGDTVVSLPSDAVYDSEDCSHATQTITIPDGKSSADFFFRTQQPGEYTLTGTSDGYTPTETQVTVQANTLNVDGTFLVDTTDHTSDLQISFILNDATSSARNICRFQFDLSEITPSILAPTSASVRIDDGTNTTHSDWACLVTDFLVTCSSNDGLEAGAITTTDIFIEGNVPPVTSVPVQLQESQPSATIPITIRSYGACADGSCSEQFVTVTGTFK